MTPDDKKTIANFSDWKNAVRRLNRDGIFTEYDPGVKFLAKDFIRRNERSVKIHLRKNGYSGPKAPKYVEANIFDTNGFAFYDPDKFNDKQVVAELEALIQASFD